MFLRFINPAIVSPYEAGILDKKPPPRIERGLKLMSKVNQCVFLFGHISSPTWNNSLLQWSDVRKVWTYFCVVEIMFIWTAAALLLLYTITLVESNIISEVERICWYWLSSKEVTFFFLSLISRLLSLMVLYFCDLYMFLMLRNGDFL